MFAKVCCPSCVYSWREAEGGRPEVVILSAVAACGAGRQHPHEVVRPASHFQMTLLLC